MKKLIEIKQIANKYARSFNVDKGVAEARGFEGSFTAFPGSRRSFAIPKRSNGRYNTGLEPEAGDSDKVIKEKLVKKQELESIIGQDLSDTSSYWDSFAVKFFLPAGTMQLNLEVPEEYLMYKAGIANNLIGPNKEYVMQYTGEHPDLLFYVFDIQEDESRKNNLQQLKDEIGAIMYQMRNNKERLYLMCAIKGKVVNETFRVETLYSFLNAERQSLTSNAQLEAFKDFIQTSNEELQARYYASKAYEKKIITIDAEKKYSYKGTQLGATLDAAKEFLARPENQETLILITLDLEELTRKVVI